MLRTTVDLKSMLLGWGVLLLVWSFFSYVLGVPEYLLASPTRVVSYMLDNSTAVFRALVLTSSQAVVGWGIAIVLGSVTGAVAYYLPAGRRILLPPLIALQTTPVIALAPLITFWFGYGWFAKVAVTSVVAMFPIVLAMYAGLGEAKSTHVHLFKLSGASELTIFWRVRLRSAWMVVLPSLKTSGVFAVIGSMVAEFMGGNDGLGFMIMKATYSSNGAMLLTAAIFSALLGQVFLAFLEKIVSPWEERWGT